MRNIMNPVKSDIFHFFVRKRNSFFYGWENLSSTSAAGKNKIKLIKIFFSIFSKSVKNIKKENYVNIHTNIQ